MRPLPGQDLTPRDASAGPPDAPRPIGDALRPHRGDALWLAAALTGDADDAEELLQEAILRAMLAMEKGHEVRDFRAWLYGTVRHLAADLTRRRVRERLLLERLLLDAPHARPPAGAPGEALERDERREVVRRAVARLGDSHRRAVELFYLRHRSLAETSRAMGLSPRVVKARLFRARAALREALTDFAAELDVSAPVIPRRITMPAVAPATRLLPPGWEVRAYPPEGFDVQPDADASPGGPAVRIDGCSEDMSAFLHFRQACRPGEWRGRRVRVSGLMRTEALHGVAHLLIGVSRRDHADLVGNGLARALRGDAGWTRVSVVGEVPDDAESLHFGLVLAGRGRVWLSRVELGAAAEDEPADTHRVAYDGPTNLDFRDATPPVLNEIAHGWFNGGSWEPPAGAGVDPAGGSAGGPCGFVRSGSEAAESLALLRQGFCPPRDMRGRRLRVSGRVRTRGVSGRAGLWLRVSGRGPRVLIDRMKRPGLTGTLDWTACQVVADVPADATRVGLGLALTGRGEAWVEGLAVEAVGEDVPATAEAHDSPCEVFPVNEAPTNLDLAMP